MCCLEVIELRLILSFSMPRCSDQLKADIDSIIVQIIQRREPKWASINHLTENVNKEQHKTDKRFKKITHWNIISYIVPVSPAISKLQKRGNVGKKSKVLTWRAAMGIYTYVRVNRWNYCITWKPYLLNLVCIYQVLHFYL